MLMSSANVSHSNETPSPTDVVLIRMDKIGDLVVTLPVDTHPALGGRRRHWFITQGLGFIPTQAEVPRDYSEFKRGFSPWRFFRVVRRLRALAPEITISLHTPWWVNMAAWWAGVPIRMGRKSQWHSFLFLNHGVRQSRSKSDRHESDYNFDLLEVGFTRLGVKATRDLHRVKESHLQLRSPDPQGTLVRKNLREREYRVVHPGMGGSAMNWPAENFVALINSLAAEGPVIITGTSADEKFLKLIRGSVSHANVRWLVGELSPTELLDVLSRAKSVVAPSTGVLHLAASLGTPTLGIYSPRAAESPTRWGPRGPRTRTIVPPAEGETPEVMKTITPTAVLNTLHLLETP